MRRNHCSHSAAVAPHTVHTPPQKQGNAARPWLTLRRNLFVTALWGQHLRSTPGVIERVRGPWGSNVYRVPYGFRSTHGTHAARPDAPSGMYRLHLKGSFVFPFLGHGILHSQETAPYDRYSCIRRTAKVFNVKIHSELPTRGRRWRVPMDYGQASSCE